VLASIAMVKIDRHNPPVNIVLMIAYYMAASVRAATIFKRRHWVKGCAGQKCEAAQGCVNIQKN